MNKRKNRLIAIILSALMVLSMAGAVWAGDAAVEGVDPLAGTGVETVDSDAGSAEGNDTGDTIVDDVQNNDATNNDDLKAGGTEGEDVQNSIADGSDDKGNGTGSGDEQNGGTDGSDTLNGDTKDGEPKDGDAKNSDVQNSDTKAGDTKDGGTKPEDSKSEDAKEEDAEEPEFISLTDTFTESADMSTEAIGMDPQTMMENVLTLNPQGRRAIPKLFASSYNGNKLGDMNGPVYNALKSMVVEVAAGRQSSTQLDVTFSDDQIPDRRWTAAELGMELYTVDSSDVKHVKAEAAAAAMDQLYDAVTVVRSVIRDCPYEMFWFGNAYYTNRTYNVHVDYNDELKEYELYFTSLTAKIDLSVSTDYRGADEYVTDPAKIQSVSGAMTNARNIINAASGMGDMEKLDYFRQQICSLVSYNYSTGSSDYGNPWQLIYVFDDDSSTNVVCEGYAKAFQYLCDESSFSTGDFATYSVAGGFQTNNGKSQGHLWNIVRMNGKNYLADVTNCDGASPSAKLFMVRATSGSVKDGYVFQVGSTSYKYTYYDYTLGLYADSELEMMDPPAQPDPEPEPEPEPQPVVHTHSWDSGKVVKNATCTAAGTKQYTCTGCKQTRTESIPATGHKPKVTASAVGATYFREGKTEEKRCSVCNTVLTASQKVPMKELSRTLVRGMTGDDVKQVQQALLDLGYEVYVADGDFGGVTEEAILQFQRDVGAYVDGEVGGQTMGYLRKALAGKSSQAGSGSGSPAPSSSTSSSGSTSSGGSASGGTGSANTVAPLTRDLSYGAQGSDVNRMQQMLAKLGYGIVVDGVFGGQSEAVVIQFQRDYGLYVDGVVGSLTYGKLAALTGGSVSGSASGSSSSAPTPSVSSGSISLSRSLSVGMTGDDVRRVQQKLQDLGYDILVDGVFGVMTQATVMSYQSYHGLVVDGVVGNQTVGSLNSR